MGERPHRLASGIVNKEHGRGTIMTKIANWNQWFDENIRPYLDKTSQDECYLDDELGARGKELQYGDVVVIPNEGDDETINWPFWIKFFLVAIPVFVVCLFCAYLFGDVFIPYLFHHILR